MKIEDIMTMKNNKMKIYTEKEVDHIINKVIALCSGKVGGIKVTPKKAPIKKELKAWIDKKLPTRGEHEVSNALWKTLNEINESL